MQLCTCTDASAPAVISCAASPAYTYSIRQHTSEYVSIVSIRQRLPPMLSAVLPHLHTHIAYVSIRHTSAYVSIRQRHRPLLSAVLPHLTAYSLSSYVSIRHTSAYASIVSIVSIRQRLTWQRTLKVHTSAYVIRQHTSYVSIRQHSQHMSASHLEAYSQSS